MKLAIGERQLMREREREREREEMVLVGVCLPRDVASWIPNPFCKGIHPLIPYTDDKIIIPLAGRSIEGSRKITILANIFSDLKIFVHSYNPLAENVYNVPVTKFVTGSKSQNQSLA